MFVATPTQAAVYQTDRSIESSPLISEEHRQRIQECLPTFLPRQYSLVSPIKRGHQDARNYIVEAGEAKYLLKLLPYDLKEEDALKELYMIQEGSLLNIAPRVFASSDIQRAVLMEYIEGPTLRDRKKISATLP